MEPTNRHPLEAITGKSGLSMLELMIPFVDYSLKLPLALFIKFYEIRMILTALRNVESAKKLGLHHPTENPMELVCALTGISPELLHMLQALSESPSLQPDSDLLSGMTQMSGLNMADLLKAMQAGSTETVWHAGSMNPAGQTQDANPYEHTTGMDPSGDAQDMSNHTDSMDYTGPSGFPTSSSNDDFETNIKKILAAYDLEQAQQM